MGRASNLGNAGSVADGLGSRGMAHQRMGDAGTTPA
jgi:hypothetical protein